jgi:hypothetical protein
MGNPNDNDAWGKSYGGDARLEPPSSSSPSPERGYCDASSTHNDSDGIVSSLTNDDSRRFRKPIANKRRSAESSEGSLSSSSSDDREKTQSLITASEGLYERVNHSEISSRKRKGQPVSVASSSPQSSSWHMDGSMILNGGGGTSEPSEIPTKRSKTGGAGTRPSKDGKRSSRKKKDHNLATVEGQLAANPGISEEEARAAAKREYHRQNAALARVRNKDMVTQLKRTVSDLTRKSADLQRANDVLRSQLEILSKQNADLVKSRTARTANALAAAPVAAPEASTVPRYPASVVVPTDQSALLLLQVMSSLLQAPPQGQVNFAPQGANLFETLLKTQTQILSQPQAPVASSNVLDPLVMGQMLAMLQGHGQVPPPSAATPIAPTQQLPSLCTLQPPHQVSPSQELSPNGTSASERQRLELLLALSSPSSASPQVPVTPLPQQASLTPVPALPAVVSDVKQPPHPSRGLVRNVSSSASTTTSPSNDMSAYAGSTLAAAAPSSTTDDATSSDLQASQLMLLLRSLSQSNSSSAQVRQG